MSANKLDIFENEELKIGFSQLFRGRQYPILCVERTESTIYGKKVKGLKAKILDGDIVIYTWLPKKFAEISDNLVTEINNAGSTSSKFSTCYYGTVKSSNTNQAFMGRIYRPNEGLNQKLYDDIGKVMEKYGGGFEESSPSKRPADVDVMPAKKLKEDSNDKF